MHQAHVVHQIPGRIRVRMPHAKGRRALLESVKESISPLENVRHVEINPATGSILVYYNPEHDQDYLRDLAEHAQRENLFDLTPPPLTEADEIAEKIDV